jgi:Ca2+-binding EF-hand superfamily protein
MTKQSLILGALLALVPALGAAQADRFRAIDRNGDGFISSEEWYGQRGVAPVPFTVVDLDGDGRISNSEFREWSSARGGANVRGITSADRFRTIDKNKDGVISAEEWKDGSLSRTPFESVDANKDGKISLREFSAWDQKRGGPAVATHGSLPGTTAPDMNERMRSLERGAAGVSGPTGVAAPPRVQSAPQPAASGSARPPESPVTTSSGIPGSSPNMRSGSGLTTK